MNNLLEYLHKILKILEQVLNHKEEVSNKPNKPKYNKVDEKNSSKSESMNKKTILKRVVLLYRVIRVNIDNDTNSSS